MARRLLRLVTLPLAASIAAFDQALELDWDLDEAPVADALA